MQEIKAIVQPFMLEHVLDALAAIEDLPGVTISQVIGWGRSRADGTSKPVREAGHAFAAKSKLEIVVRAEQVERVLDAIVRSARTGKTGDGKVFVLEVSRAVRIRTGEQGEAAI